MYKLVVILAYTIAIPLIVLTIYVYGRCTNCVYIPVVTKDQSAVVAANPQPIAFVSSYRDQKSLTVYTQYWEVENVSGAAICDLVLDVYIERDNAAMLDERAYALLPRIAPGQRMPVVAVISSLQPITGYLVYDLEYNDCAGREVIDVEASSVTLGASELGVTVSGAITNTSAYPLREARAAVVAYAPNGEIRYARVGYPFPGFDLPVGISKTYTEETYEQDLGNVTFRALAQGYR